MKNKSYEDYVPKVFVTCSKCYTEFDENSITDIDIEEDILGRDKVSFKCPKCGQDASSLRYTKVRTDRKVL